MSRVSRQLFDGGGSSDRVTVTPEPKKKKERKGEEDKGERVEEGGGSFILTALCGCRAPGELSLDYISQ